MSDKTLLAQENAALRLQLAERSRSLAEAEARYHAVFDSSHSLMALCTMDGVVLDVNRTALQAVGRGIEEFIGKHLWETPWFASNPDEAAKLQAALTRARGQFVAYETRVLSRKGDWRWVEFTFRPYRSQLGSEARFLVFEGREAPARVEGAPESAAGSR